MRMIRLIPLFAFSVFLSALSYADCIKDERSSKTSGVSINVLSIVGVRTLSSDELANITSEFIGTCFNDDSEELGNGFRPRFKAAGISWHQSRTYESRRTIR